MFNLDNEATKVVNEFINNEEMFTVHNVKNILRMRFPNENISHDDVRNVVEQLYSGLYLAHFEYYRDIGYHLPLNPPPQIYFNPNKHNINDFKVSSARNLQKTLVSKNQKGLYKFNVWLNGKLVPCKFVQKRGSKGLFVENNDFEGYGLLEDGRRGVVRQDSDGKLYISINN